MKKIINESELRSIVSESVKRILTEIFDTDYDGFGLGVASGLANRASKSPRAMVDKGYKERKQRQERLFGDEGRKTADALKSHIGFDTNDFNLGRHWGKKGYKNGHYAPDGKFTPFREYDPKFYSSREDLRNQSINRHGGLTRPEVNNLSPEEYNEKIANTSEEDRNRLYHEKLRNKYTEMLNGMNEDEMNAFEEALNSFWDKDKN